MRRNFMLPSFVFDDDNGGGSGGGTPPPAPPAPASTPPAGYISQEQQNAIDRRTRLDTRNQVMSEVEQALGMSLDEMKKKLDTDREAETARLSEIEKRERKLDERDREIVERERAAKLAERDASIIAGLVERGVTVERDDDGKLKGKAARVAQLVRSELTDDADAAAIVVAFDAVKSDMPELFVTSSAPPGQPQQQPSVGPNGQPLNPPGAPPSFDPFSTPPPSGQPPVTPPANPPSSTDFDKGQELAKQFNERNKPFDPLAEFGTRTG